MELERWGLGDTAVDPGLVLLRLVTQSAARVDLYSRLLGEAYEAAERLRFAHEAERLVIADPDVEATARVQAAHEDLKRIFGTGGVAALVGNTYAVSNGSLYATGEALRGLQKLESEERDRCANFAAKAVAAGLAERQIRLAEQQGALLAAVIAEIVTQLGHNPHEPRTSAVISGTIQRLTGIQGAA